MKKNQILRTIMTITLTAVITFSITSLWLYGNNNIKKYVSNIRNITIRQINNENKYNKEQDRKRIFKRLR